MTTARHAEAERSPRVSTQNFVPTPSPIRPPVRRIWASLPLASSPQARTPLTALRFRSVRYCIVGLLPDAPSRVVRCCERPCLVDGGFPPSGPQEDLTLTCLTSLFCVHAEHTKASLAALAAYAALTRPACSRSDRQLWERRADPRRHHGCVDGAPRSRGAPMFSASTEASAGQVSSAGTQVPACILVKR